MGPLNEVDNTVMVRGVGNMDSRHPLNFWGNGGY